MLLFSDIGFKLPEENSFPALVNTIMEKGKVLESPRGKYLHLQDNSGASLFAQVTVKNQIIGVLPFFEGQTSIQVAITKKAIRSETELEGALHAWAAPEDPGNPESGLFPFVFEVPDYYTHDFNFPLYTRINLTCFATAAPEITQSEQSYNQNPGNHALGLGTRSFIPTGLFEADELDGPSSKALITGLILKAELKKNQSGKGEFFHLQIETQGGEIDMVISRELLKEIPQKGNVISGKFWLCGKILNS